MSRAQRLYASAISNTATPSQRTEINIPSIPPPPPLSATAIARIQPSAPPAVLPRQQHGPSFQAASPSPLLHAPAPSHAQVISDLEVPPSSPSESVANSEYILSYNPAPQAQSLSPPSVDVPPSAHVDVDIDHDFQDDHEPALGADLIRRPTLPTYSPVAADGMSVNVESYEPSEVGHEVSNSEYVCVSEFGTWDSSLSPPPFTADAHQPSLLEKGDISSKGCSAGLVAASSTQTQASTSQQNRRQPLPTPPDSAAAITINPMASSSACTPNPRTPRTSSASAVATTSVMKGTLSNRRVSGPRGGPASVPAQTQQMLAQSRTIPIASTPIVSTNNPGPALVPAQTQPQAQPQDVQPQVRDRSAYARSLYGDAMRATTMPGPAATPSVSSISMTASSRSSISSSRMSASSSPAPSIAATFSQSQDSQSPVGHRRISTEPIMVSSVPGNASFTQVQNVGNEALSGALAPSQGVRALPTPASSPGAGVATFSSVPQVKQAIAPHASTPVLVPASQTPVQIGPNQTIQKLATTHNTANINVTTSAQSTSPMAPATVFPSTTAPSRRPYRYSTAMVPPPPPSSNSSFWGTARSTSGGSVSTPRMSNTAPPASSSSGGKLFSKSFWGMSRAKADQLKREELDRAKWQRDVNAPPVASNGPPPGAVMVQDASVDVLGQAEDLRRVPPPFAQAGTKAQLLLSNPGEANTNVTTVNPLSLANTSAVPIDVSNILTGQQVGQTQVQNPYVVSSLPSPPTQQQEGNVPPPAQLAQGAQSLRNSNFNVSQAKLASQQRGLFSTLGDAAGRVANQAGLGGVVNTVNGVVQGLQSSTGSSTGPYVASYPVNGGVGAVTGQAQVQATQQSHSNMGGTVAAAMLGGAAGLLGAAVLENVLEDNGNGNVDLSSLGDGFSQLTDNVDLSQLMNIDLSQFTDNVDPSQLTNNIDLSQLTNNLDISQFMSNLDLSQSANDIDLDPSMANDNQFSFDMGASQSSDGAGYDFTPLNFDGAGGSQMGTDAFNTSFDGPGFTFGGDGGDAINPIGGFDTASINGDFYADNGTNSFPDPNSGFSFDQPAYNDGTYTPDTNAYDTADNDGASVSYDCNDYGAPDFGQQIYEPEGGGSMQQSPLQSPTLPAYDPSMNGSQDGSGSDGVVNADFGPETGPVYDDSDGSQFASPASPGPGISLSPTQDGGNGYNDDNASQYGDSVYNADGNSMGGDGVSVTDEPPQSPCSYQSQSQSQNGDWGGSQNGSQDQWQDQDQNQGPDQSQDDSSNSEQPEKPEKPEKPNHAQQQQNHQHNSQQTGQSHHSQQQQQHHQQAHQHGNDQGGQNNHSQHQQNHQHETNQQEAQQQHAHQHSHNNDGEPAPSFPSPSAHEHHSAPDPSSSNQQQQNYEHHHNSGQAQPSNDHVHNAHPHSTAHQHAQGHSPTPHNSMPEHSGHEIANGHISHQQSTSVTQEFSGHGHGHQSGPVQHHQASPNAHAFPQPMHHESVNHGNQGHVQPGFKPSVHHPVAGTIDHAYSPTHGTTSQKPPLSSMPAMPNLSNSIQQLQALIQEAASEQSALHAQLSGHITSGAHEHIVTTAASLAEAQKKQEQLVQALVSLMSTNGGSSNGSSGSATSQIAPPPVAANNGPTTPSAHGTSTGNTHKPTAPSPAHAQHSQPNHNHIQSSSSHNTGSAHPHPSTPHTNNSSTNVAHHHRPPSRPNGAHHRPQRPSHATPSGARPPASHTHSSHTHVQSHSPGHARPPSAASASHASAGIVRPSTHAPSHTHAHLPSRPSSTVHNHHNSPPAHTHQSNNSAQATSPLPRPPARPSTGQSHQHHAASTNQTQASQRPSAPQTGQRPPQGQGVRPPLPSRPSATQTVQAGQASRPNPLPTAPVQAQGTGQTQASITPQATGLTSASADTQAQALQQIRQQMLLLQAAVSASENKRTQQETLLLQQQIQQLKQLQAAIATSEAARIQQQTAQFKQSMAQLQQLQTASNPQQTVQILQQYQLAAQQQQAQALANALQNRPNANPQMFVPAGTPGAVAHNQHNGVAEQLGRLAVKGAIGVGGALLLNAIKPNGT